MRLSNLLLAAACSAALPFANAEVQRAAPDGFLVTYSAPVKASPAKAYAAIVDIGQWWNGEHSYSGNPANLSLRSDAGACFCERWSGGSVEHGVVVMALQDQVLRIASALGPLQGRAVTGMLTFETKPQDGGTLLRMSYIVNGSSASALDKSAPGVDGVLAEQFQRLTRYIEAGSPVATK